MHRVKQQNIYLKQTAIEKNKESYFGLEINFKNLMGKEIVVVEEMEVKLS